MRCFFFLSEKTGLVISPTIIVEHLKNIFFPPLLLHHLHHFLFNTHSYYFFLRFFLFLLFLLFLLLPYNNLVFLRLAISRQGIDDILYGFVVGEHLLVMTTALCGVFGTDVVTHEEVDLHESLILPILLEQLHILTQEVDVLPVLVRLPVTLLGLPTTRLLQPSVVLLGRKHLLTLSHQLLTGEL